jgi:uncharacterized protein
MRNRSWTLAGCLAMCLFAASPALSQSPPPDALTAARELLLTMRFIDQFKAVLPIIAQNLKPAIVQNRPEVEREFDNIMPKLMDGMGARLAELSEQTAIIYANNFSAAELKEITAFFRTPTGEKYLQKLPVITQQSMAAGQSFGQAVAIELRNRIVEEIQKQGASPR